MGPLAGIKIVELAGIGPVPFCAMALADQGAEVLRIDRTVPAGLGIGLETQYEVLKRGRRSVAVDLKHPQGAETVLRLVEAADGLLEGFRPGVTERLGLGPETCLARNPKLVYGRMTGWGQEGPLAKDVGHDINYIALAGVLGSIGQPGGPPVPPINLVGDFGGGGMFLAFGMVSALLEATRSGSGQVVDVAMTEGAAYLMASIHGMFAAGKWKPQRGSNIIDGGAHFYGVYETACGGYISIGSIEPKFYAELLERLGLEAAELPQQFDREHWPALRTRLAEIIKTRTRDEWEAAMAEGEICFAPVLGLEELGTHPHHAARESFIQIAGVQQPAPTPRFSRTAPEVSRPPAYDGEHTREALRDWGFGEAEVQGLLDSGAVSQY